MAPRLRDEVGAWLGRNHIRIAIAVFVAAVLIMFAVLGGCTQVTVVAGEGNKLDKDSGVIMVKPKGREQ